MLLFGQKTEILLSFFLQQIIKTETWINKFFFCFQKVKSLKLFQVSIKYIQTIDSFVHRQSSIRIKQKQDSVCLFYDSCFFSDSFRIFVCVCVWCFLRRKSFLPYFFFCLSSDDDDKLFICLLWSSRLFSFNFFYFSFRSGL